MYAYKTWISILRVDHIFRVLENRMMTEIFEPKRAEVTRERRKLCNEDPHNIYSLLNIIRDVRSRNMTLVAYVEYMEKIKDNALFLSDILKGRVNLV
jgi:hypothetical protein